MSMSDCESSLSVFETPNCNFSANPFNLVMMPLAPRPSKKLLSKRIFLDLENNHFAPAFPSSPRSKKAKPSSSAFIRHEQSSTEFRTSLIRLLNGESLQRLKEERAAAAAAAAVSELYDDDASVDTLSDNDEAIQSAALLFPASSISAGSRRASSCQEKESSSTGNHDTVVLGRRIQRRSSGIARCA